MGNKVLSLETIEPDRNWIEIDGAKFYLRSNDELSLKQLGKLSALSKLPKMDATSKEEDFELIQSTVDGLLDVVVIGLTDEAKDKLLTAQKFQIVSAFTTAASKGPRIAAGGNGSPPTSEGSSQSSGGSTVELSATG
jgi:hypothetical protein